MMHLLPMRGNYNLRARSYFQLYQATHLIRVGVNVMLDGLW